MTSAGSPKQCTIAYSVGRQYPVGKIVVWSVNGEEYIVERVSPSQIVQGEYLHWLRPLGGGTHLPVYGSELEPLPEIKLLPVGVGDRVSVLPPYAWPQPPADTGTVVQLDGSGRWVLVAVDYGISFKFRLLPTCDVELL